MKSTYVYFLALCLTLLMACAPSIYVSTDYDRAANFSNYKTFKMMELQNNGQLSELNAGRIIRSIREEMTRKGFQEVSVNPDLQINAMTFMKDKKVVTANTDYYGYGGIYRPYGYWGGVPASTTYSSYDYKDGSLIIDIIDAKSNKLVWQGTGNAEIDSAPSNPDEFIKNAVVKILAGFPPGQLPAGSK